MKNIALRLFFLLTLPLALCLCSSPSEVKDDKVATDSELSQMCMELYDSISSPSFPKMYDELLRKSQEAGNEAKYITTRRMLISKYSIENEQKKFIEESDRLITYCQESGTEAANRMIYEVWAFKADRLKMWGRNEEEIECVQQMADYAQQNHHDNGIAMAELRLGVMYQSRHQLDVSENHFRTAWDIALKNDYNNMAVRIGLNMLALKINTFDYEGGLALADSVETIISKSRAAGTKIAPVTMLNLARYRCKLLYIVGDLKAAESQKDTMMYWYGVDSDPSQWQGVLYTIAGYKLYARDFDGACEDFDTLIQMAKRNNNWSLVANYAYAQADTRRQQGNMDKAVDAYLLYAEARDSATVQTCNLQLNELTKKYELNELRLEKKRAEYRFLLMLGIALFIMSIFIGYFIYTRKLHAKNRALYDKISQMDKLQDDWAEQKSRTPESELSEEEILFNKLNSLMQRDKLFRDSQLNREVLATALGTNTRYLAEAVKNSASGQTVSEYINNCRLREAAELLTFRKEMSIVEVGEESGFGSNATFFRLFKNRFEMTPSEYREIALEMRKA